MESILHPLLIPLLYLSRQKKNEYNNLLQVTEGRTNSFTTVISNCAFLFDKWFYHKHNGYCCDRMVSYNLTNTLTWRSF